MAQIAFYFCPLSRLYQLIMYVVITGFGNSLTFILSTSVDLNVVLWFTCILLLTLSVTRICPYRSVVTPDGPWSWPLPLPFDPIWYWNSPNLFSTWTLLFRQSEMMMSSFLPMHTKAGSLNSPGLLPCWPTLFMRLPEEKQIMFLHIFVYWSDNIQSCCFSSSF